MKIFLFRHGQINNPKDVFPGRLPGYHLSNEGRRKVVESAGNLKKENIQRIYTSPLERTLETAEITAKILDIDPKNIEINNQIIEVESSYWQGRKKDDFKKNSEYMKNPFITSDMEGRKDSGKRVFDFLKKIAKKNENAVVVSHGDPIMGAIGYITGRWKDLDKNYIQERNILYSRN